VIFGISALAQASERMTRIGSEHDACGLVSWRAIRANIGPWTAPTARPATPRPFLARRAELLKYRSSSASLRREGEGEMTGLVELAQRYVPLSAELEGTRNAMRNALANGSDGNHTRAGSSARPTRE
jgi:hypothetical protein